MRVTNTDIAIGSEGKDGKNEYYHPQPDVLTERIASEGGEYCGELVQNLPDVAGVETSLRAQGR